jgi:nicotinate-nucleotide adenylyltransferase
MPRPPRDEGASGRSRRQGPSRAERIGLLGGTFDPPHCGHLAVAQAAMRSLELDRLLLVVANEPWQKVPLRAVTPAEDRLAMVEAIVALVPGAEVSALEIDRGGPSYTVDTVDALVSDAARRGATLEVYLVVGADLVSGLDTWHRVDDLRDEVTLAVVSRPHAAGRPPPGWKAVYLHDDMVDVSSSEVRDRLERGLPVDGLVPPEVIRCITARGLYAVSG